MQLGMAVTVIALYGMSIQQTIIVWVFYFTLNDIEDY